MKIGMIGLGRMGANMVKRLLADRTSRHECVVYDQSEAARAALNQPSAIRADGLESLVGRLESPRTIWLMLPAGDPTENTLRKLAPLLRAGDTVVDGGNSFYKDGTRRAAEFKSRNIDYLDVGVSGGVWGLQNGYCLMIGGPPQAAKRLEPIFRTLAPAPDKGWVYCGGAGAGHFVKMIHNGIEYGMMQSLAEGFQILKNSAFDLDTAAIAQTWRHGSVVSSWLLDLTAQALQNDPQLSRFKGIVQDSGEGRWTLQAAIEQGDPAECLAAALCPLPFAATRKLRRKILSAMRHGFGGHQELKKGA